MINKKPVTGKGLDKVFNILGEEETIKEVELPLALEENESEIIGDSDFIRTELKGNIDTAKKALARALEIQEEDEKARNTEVISDLIDTINSCLSQLINLNKIEADINIKKEKLGNNDSSPATTNNILVTGNTSDILKQLAIEMKKS